MRKWAKRWAIVAASVLGLAVLLTPAQAQFSFGAGPDGPAPDAAGGPGGPAPGAPPKESPFSLRNDGSPNGFNDDDGSRPPEKPYIFTFRGEYLNWRVSGGHLAQPLVTTSTSPDINADRGAFGQIDTQTLVGAGNYSYGAAQGGRLTVGVAPDNFIPIEIGGMWFASSRSLFGFTSDGTPGTAVISRPIQLSDITGQLGLPTEDVSLVNFPGSVAGQIHINSALSVWSVEANIFCPLAETDVLGLACFVGYRHANMAEQLDIFTTTAPVGGTVLNFDADPNGFTTPNYIGVVDSFRVVNQFDGGQLGLRAALSGWRLTFSTDLKLAMGNTHSTFSSAGASTLFAVPGSVTLPGGVLALPSNSMTVTQNRFSVIPQADFHLRFKLCDYLSIIGGYNVFYWTSVIRAGDYVRRTVNSQEVPTDINFTPGFTPAANPASLHSTGFLAHGISIGVEFGF